MATIGLAAPKAETEVRSRTRQSSNEVMRVWLDERLKRGKTKIFTERVRVTPVLASLLLERNKSNRKVRQVKLDQYKSDMNANRFKFNGETIIVSKEGELNDGQHRLLAIVETNKPQDMLIAFGLDRNTRDTVDSGAARTASDHLSVKGWPYASAIASVSRMALGYERMDGVAIGRTHDISSPEVLNRAERDTLLQECASYTATNPQRWSKVGKAAIVGFCFYLFSQKNPRIAKGFVDKLLSGAELKETDPIRIAREYLIARPKLLPVQKVEVLVRAWNAWVKDKEIKHIKLMGKIPPVEG